MNPQVARTIGAFDKLRFAACAKVAKTKTIALVPTMGALHAGHLSLVRRARDIADVVVVSIYVNPLQFGIGEDFGDYPRGLAADCRMLEGLADIVFAPDDKLMYPERQEITIALPPVAGELCGRSRPGFFEGVATAVCKLLNITRPDYALFGKKDYQQWILMNQMARQLNIGTKVIACKTMREKDGLACSSRNAYLTPKQRQTAPLLYRTLQTTAAAIKQQTSNKRAKEYCAKARATLKAAGFVVDYFELVDAKTLAAQATNKAVILAAATIGKTRLIDNIELTMPRR